VASRQAKLASHPRVVRLYPSSFNAVNVRQRSLVDKKENTAGQDQRQLYVQAAIYPSWSTVRSLEDNVQQTRKEWHGKEKNKRRWQLFTLCASSADDLGRLFLALSLNESCWGRFAPRWPVAGAG